MNRLYRRIGVLVEDEHGVERVRCMCCMHVFVAECGFGGECGCG